MVLAVFAAYHRGLDDFPAATLGEIQQQMFLRAFICSVISLPRVHLYLFVSPPATRTLFLLHFGAGAPYFHPRFHLPRVPAHGSDTGTVQLQRYKTFLEFLRSGEDSTNHERSQVQRITKLVLCDTLDVVFQSDPFPFIIKGLYTAEELPTHVMGQKEHVVNSVNAIWVRELYGQQVLDTMADHYVVCSGVTMGTRAHVEGYLEAMSGEIQERMGSNYDQLHSKLLELGRKVGYEKSRGFDQGVHNVLVRGRLRANTTVYDGWHGLMLHGNDLWCNHVAAANGALQLFPPKSNKRDLKRGIQPKTAPCKVHSHGPYKGTLAAPSAATSSSSVSSSTPSACDHMPLPVILHQYGRVHGACRPLVRQVLSCRSTTHMLPMYCDYCQLHWPSWFGDPTRSWNRSHNGDTTVALTVRSPPARLDLFGRPPSVHSG